MEAVVVSAVHGAMGTLLAKLAALLTDKYKLAKEAKGQIRFLKTELESMYAFLTKMSSMENPDKQDEWWAKEVRELSYDIEDSVNEFMLFVDRRSSNKPHGFKGFMERSMHLLTTINTRLKITKEFEDLKSRVMEVSQRHMRYKVDDAVSKPNNITIDRNLLAIHVERTGLVGIDGPRDELIQLMEVGGAPAHQLKVFSIVGFGGLGKTTLANEIHRKLKGQFQCQAFVSVSQKPNIRKILRTILSQVVQETKHQEGFRAHEDTNIETWDKSEFISELQKFLHDKRYFIVIDDIWDASAWDIIRCAFPESRNGSRIITTTRIETVGRACCTNHSEYVYKMKPLSDHDSKSLFFKRIFGSEDACPPYLNEVSAKILKKCGGLPLAITTISSLLANEPNKWQYVLNSLGSNLEVCPCLEGMREILNLSYIHLPHYLKTCMLYLGIYPEDHTIRKEDLVRQWEAEGFPCNVRGTNLEDVANSYFNELINRSMIQPTQIFKGEVIFCRVHDMMLDLIVHRSRKENFITVIDDIQEMIGQHDKIRRLTLHLDGVVDDRVVASVQLSQIRTLARFGTSSYLPPLQLFKHLRVLTIEIETSEGSQSEAVIDFTRICHLLQLRYLKIVTNLYDVVLPSKIGNLLQLETFHIGFRCYIDNGNSSVDKMMKRHREVLRACLEKLCNLKYLKVNSPIMNPSWCLDELGKLHPSFCHLKEFYSYGGLFSRIPQWIVHLHNLYDLQIHVKEVLEHDVGMLAQLHSLTILFLHVKGVPENKIIVRGDGFHVLKRFILGCHRVSCLTFETGAMPKLEELTLRFNAHGWDNYGAAPAGIEHLSGLKEIFIKIGGDGAKESNRRAAEAALRNATEMHPGRPTAHIECNATFSYHFDDSKPREQDDDVEDMFTAGQCGG